MYLAIALFALAGVGLILFIYFKIRKRYYTKFVKKYSLAYKKVIDINNKYQFLNCSNIVESHTYDNENFYNDISCQDYLIYELQFKKKEIYNKISNANKNRNKYTSYCNDINSIKNFGTFDRITDKMNMKYLLSIEKQLIEEIKIIPQMYFEISIYLYCSKINGEIYSRKYQTFSEKEILGLIQRLNDKNMDYYNDKGIWYAICRVERGKVSNKMRFAIYERDCYRCRICGRGGRFAELEIDHIKPIAKGGKTTYYNLQTLCRSCNKYKGDTYYE